MCKGNLNIDLHYYIGFTKEEKIRFASSSGGIGTAIIKYLLESGKYGTSMTFVFNTDDCKYEPKLIYDFSEYNNCGSVYQDVDVINFIKDNRCCIKNGIVVTCMPCQVNAIRSILNRNNIKCFIVSLCCSGQTTIQGTWLYYKLLGVEKANVCNIQYRGNGWPSGIQILLKHGGVIKKDNYTYPWNLIHKSLLYRPKRCLFCTIKTNPNSDVSLADPWLKEYIGNDKMGNSIVITNLDGDRVLKEMLDANLLSLKKVTKELYVKSQLGTIEYKAQSKKHVFFNKLVGRMAVEGSIYKNIVTSSVFFLKLHVKFISLIHKII